ncbi:efflux transporter outer membrane subunit [Desulfoplanes formicivorans]|uniref:RND transporter n=1 Tax=Desulfoplanes formicivorans TaxID=1592317 RepID=A0A194ABZ2_9BACT|nr:efflux transporter outer membrane subunit [Desulfoplanes formicivorans]GAU07667.1 RND transporter [Desulfoplanes formicivorans]
MRLSLCLSFVIILVVVTGCAPFAPRSADIALPDLPARYSLYVENATLSMPWWQEFGSSELDRLMDIALSQGFSIRQARARLDQARASALKAGASLVPSVSLEAGSSHTRQKWKNGSSSGQTYTTTKEHSLGLAAQYELDLWDRIGSTREAERLEAQATQEDVHTAFMTLSGQIVENWVEILQVRGEQALVKEQIQTNERYLEVLELRFDNSLSTALDVLQQREALARSRAMLPTLEARERVLMHETAVLMGKSPDFDLGLTGHGLPEPLPLPGTGIPADLLASRPDVRAAGLRLKSSQWEIASARADRLPAITITGRAEYSSDQFNTLFDNWLANLAAGLTGPIFDGNRRSAEVDRTRAVARERLAAYQQTVMEAVRDVENALVNIDKQQAYLAATQKQLDIARMTLQQARQRYENGVVTYLTVLTSLLNVQSLERTLVQGQADLLLYQVGLHRALGGTWYRKLEEQAQTSIHDKAVTPTMDTTHTSEQGQS